MADQQQTEFVYHNIQLYKSKSLGNGSYGGVCKAKCDGLLCAAKILHPTLFDLRDPGTASYLRKFLEECHLLSLARHPNVVQYLATYYDPDTRLPVLLMELCEESLTAFLERSPGSLSYHIQINICLDIALALVYLHSNDLIHRDLTGNNVLMNAGTRAKITDFGMSKLATGNPHIKALTLCPGNLLYMSPEALDEAKSYTAKLDVFSFGVLVIQILTRQFPNPTDRFCTIYAPQYEEEIRRVVPETERRQIHLKLISDTHRLKPLALQCLKKEMLRPSALQLSERLSELKQASQYTESMHQAQSSSEIKQLKLDLQSQIEAKTKEASEHQAHSAQLQSVVEAKDRQLQEIQQKIADNQRMLSTKEQVINIMERQLQQTKMQLKATQQSLLRQNKTITDLQQTVSHHEREIRQLKQLDIASSILPQELPVTAQTATAVSVAQKDISKMTWREGKKAPQTMPRGAAAVHGNTAYFRPVTAQTATAVSVAQKDISKMTWREGKKAPQTMARGAAALHGNTAYFRPVTAQTATAVSVVQKDISKMTWREGKKAPQTMARGAAAVHGNTAYFRPSNSARVYSYQNIPEYEQWSRLQDNPNLYFSLAVIDGLLTSVGGYVYRDPNNYVATNTLLTLTKSEKKQDWSEIFPPMPTPRSLTACISIEKALVVAGGYSGSDLDTVEVMDINIKQWTKVSPFPQKLRSLSGIACGNSLYLAGGDARCSGSKSVFTCSLTDLWQPMTDGSRMQLTYSRKSNVWKQIRSLPVAFSTLVSLDGHMLAVGGQYNSGIHTTDAYRYNFHTNSWDIIGQMKNKLMRCFVVSLCEHQLIIVGGWKDIFNTTDFVEVFEDK